MSWLPSNDPILGDPRTCDALDLVIVPRTRDLGDGFAVRRALPHGKIALSGELGIGVHHQRAGNTEVAGEVAGRWEYAAGLQRAVANGVAKLPLDLRLQGFRRSAVEGEQQFGLAAATGQVFLLELVITFLASSA